MSKLHATFNPESNAEPPPRAQSESRRLLLGALVGATLVAIGGGTIWLATREAPPPQTTPSFSEQALPLAPPPPTHTLDRQRSDERIQNVARGLSSHAAFREWLRADDLARRLAAAVNAVAEGESPREPLSMLAPSGTFEVIESPSGAYISAASFARYNTVARVVDGLDVRKVAAVWATVAPVVRLAWAEIAPPGSHVEKALGRALDRLISTPVPSGPIAVTGRGAIWAFADPRLESLSSAEKHLIRMGATNQRLIQNRLIELRKALDLTVM